MTIRELTEILKNKNIQHESSIAIDEDDLDRKYEYSNKKHRNWLAQFDHYYELISHPFIITVIFIAIIFIFILFRYLETACPENLLYGKIHNDTWTVLGYFATVAITAIVTKYFEKRKKEHHKEQA